jgi:RND family efflux transporter MFP subunit
MSIRRFMTAGAAFAALTTVAAQAPVPSGAGADAIGGEPPPLHECLLTPHLVVAVGSPVAGVLDSVEIERGDRVRVGQVIAQLSSGLERAAVDLARTRAEFEQRRVERNRDLDQDELISEHERDEMATQSVIAALELAEATQMLEMRTILSPLDGVVVERTGAPGELIQESPIATLAQIDPLNVEVVLPVALFGRVAVGDVAQVVPAEPVGGEYPAKVVIVDRVIDAASGTFGVRLELPNPGSRLPAGLQCRVRFTATAAQASH